MANINDPLSFPDAADGQPGLVVLDKMPTPIEGDSNATYAIVVGLVVCATVALVVWLASRLIPGDGGAADVGNPGDGSDGGD